MIKNKKSTREAAGQAILELAREGLDVVAISADTSKSMFTTLLKEEFPDRFIDTGIAEQNMMTVAAGIASTGKIVFAASYSVFTSMRCCEQLRTFVAYPNLNVKVIAGLGGFSAAIEGVTHLATEDLGIVRCIANMAVIAPSDFVTTKKAVKQAAAYNGPVYIRIGRDPSPVLFDENYQLEIGKAVVHKKGSQVTIAGTGLVMAEVFEAVKILEQEGIDAGVIEVHTLKPILNPQLILDQVLSTKKLITVEEHNIVGGLGTVMSEIIAGQGKVQIKKLGLEDTFGESGTPEELYEKYGIIAANIVKEAKNMLK